MFGPADPLHQTLDVFGRADLHHEVHIPPVDPQIERPGTDHRAQLPGDHRRLNLFALRTVERAMVNADRQPFLIGKPQVSKENFRLCAGIVKNQRGFMRPYQIKHFGNRIGPAAPRPGGQFIRFQHSNIGRGTGVGMDDLRLLWMAGEIVPHGRHVFHRGRKTDPTQPRAERLQPRQA